MPRVIKFRGKSVKDGVWVFGDLIHTSTNKTAIWPNGNETYNGIVEVNPTTIGQFTGLKDRKGNEIYEGDVVRQEWETVIADDLGDAFDSSGTQTGIVVIRSRGVCISPCLCVSGHNDEALITRNKPLTGYRCKIIGNSHDDPNLFDEICKS